MREITRLPAGELEQKAERDEERIDLLLGEAVKRSGRKIVVLDDDPTGVQTVHDVSVYTDWSEESVLKGFQEEGNLFYILTNSRGFTEDETIKAHRQIAGNIVKAARATGRDFLIMSRGDSTLRGHYPLETQVLRDVLGREGQRETDGEVICPFFKEGGRFTMGNIHYVRYGGELVPAGETEFAADRTFGYRSSNLADYVEEKTKGAYPAGDVICIGLDDLRWGRVDKVAAQLMEVRDFNKVIVNAVDYGDLKVFALALYEAMEQGKRFLFRTAASLVKVMGAITDQPLLTRVKMAVPENGHGGVIVVGSHTAKTTRQLEELKKVPGIRFLEFNSDLVLNDAAFREETERTLELISRTIEEGKTAAVYTRRKLLEFKDDTREAALTRSVKISEAVQSLVGNLKVVPAFVVAKGGITSSDVGTKALRVKRATVMGQICPGVPVWQTGGESRFPHIPYVIFPGNVGEDTTLREAVEILLGR